MARSSSEPSSIFMIGNFQELERIFARQAIVPGCRTKTEEE